MSIKREVVCDSEGEEVDEKEEELSDSEYSSEHS